MDTNSFDVSTGGGALAALRAANEDDTEEDLMIIPSDVPPSSNVLSKSVATANDNACPPRVSKTKTVTGDLFSTIDLSDVLVDLQQKQNLLSFNKSRVCCRV